jgi:ornithine carbamoyltransferase
MNLINLADLSGSDIQSIWDLAGKPPVSISGNVAWSFEGNGIRTRTSFIQAFRDISLGFTELPNLLKTNERVRDLAGYLDPFYDIYVIREANHLRLTEFANASQRPVVNAMSGDGHPCEVLTDAYFIDSVLLPILQARICLWGPPTNVFRSWHELAKVLGIQIVQVCSAQFHTQIPNVTFTESVSSEFDIVVIDGWSKDLDEFCDGLTLQHLAMMGNPKLLPTPPFTIGRELTFDPLAYVGFVGYKQKELLLPVQKAILRYLLECE